MRRPVRVLGAAWLLAAAMMATLCLVAPAHADVRAALDDFQNGRFAEAFQGWQADARAGNADAALYVGVMYDTGLGVAQDYAQARLWYERASAAGNVTGTFNAAVMRDAGLGGPRDPVSAAEWYQRAGEQGSGRAEYNLGLMYEAGLGVPRDAARAVRLFRAAASHGISAAHSHLGRLGYRSALVTRPKEDPAMQAFQRAQNALLTRGTTDAAQAIALFQRAADAGNPLAEYDLGYCYEHGIGVPVDRDRASLLYRRAAQHAGDPALRAIAESGLRNLAQAGTQAQR